MKLCPAAAFSLNNLINTVVTGVEVTGIILANLLLLVNQTDHYVQGLGILKLFRAKWYLSDMVGYLEPI